MLFQELKDFLQNRMRMSHMLNFGYKLLFLLFFITISQSCAHPKNDGTAYEVTIGGQRYVKIFGGRVKMAHDPISALFPDRYKDSVFFPLPALGNGVKKGEDIPVQKGYYNYTGEISVDGNQIVVNLQLNNTDSNTLSPSPWNGKYRLISLE